MAFAKSVATAKSTASKPPTGSLLNDDSSEVTYGRRTAWPQDRHRAKFAEAMS
jgi:hypothetical protein